MEAGTAFAGPGGVYNSMYCEPRLDAEAGNTGVNTIAPCYASWLGEWVIGVNLYDN